MKQSTRAAPLLYVRTLRCINKHNIFGDNTSAVNARQAHNHIGQRRIIKNRDN